ncbi:propanediol dehydratase large subunit [Salmonella enterica subsp. enterica serovar Typhimurium]|nr:propanediol dehydratase large subunit [Salmonella enterica subsp. enterica serovar Typhimurium]
MRSKRFEALAKRPVNQDGFVKEWIEEGFIAMESPNDPKPSIKIVNGAVTEAGRKPVSEFDLIDHFIARYGINLNRAEESDGGWIRSSWLTCCAIRTSSAAKSFR